MPHNILFWSLAVHGNQNFHLDRLEQNVPRWSVHATNQYYDSELDDDGTISRCRCTPIAETDADEEPVPCPAW